MKNVRTRVWLLHLSMMKRLALMAMLLSGCGATSFDQCETERINYTCGTTHALRIDCAQYKSKTCNVQSMDRWLKCSRAAHVCTNEMLNAGTLTATLAGCGFPDCVAK